MGQGEFKEKKKCTTSLKGSHLVSRPVHGGPQRGVTIAGNLYGGDSCRKENLDR